MIDLSSVKPQLQGKPVAILGLGKTGLQVHAACKKAGIDTVLWDDNEDKRKEAEKAGGTLEDLTQADFSRFACLCMSPGIPLTHPKPHPAARRAKAAGVEVLGDIELFHRARPHTKTIGITGTNGKSTTTALIGHILARAHVPSAVGGNIGDAVLSLPDLEAGGIYVLELSSYQLDLCTTFSPDIAVMLNITPDHLDRHGDMAGYAAAKERIFRGKGVAILGIDDKPSADMFSRVKTKGERKTIALSYLRPLQHGVFISPEGTLFDGAEGLVNLHTCKALKGRHNWQNAAAAYAACRAAGVSPEVIIEGLQSFPGLAHRQKLVTVQNGISYINDSKATNDDAAAVALGTYNPIYWIAGGRAKEGGYAACQKHLGHVRHAFLIGEAAQDMAKWLQGRNIPHTVSETLDKAVVAAHALAQKEELNHATVLLSPACASFDQFKNFEARGDAFTDLVLRVTGADQKKATEA
jgi:UDP-N-acetylmuramoylalanine--D-glutamate ligase